MHVKIIISPLFFRAVAPEEWKSFIVCWVSELHSIELLELFHEILKMTQHSNEPADISDSYFVCIKLLYYNIHMFTNNVYLHI